MNSFNCFSDDIYRFDHFIRIAHWKKKSLPSVRFEISLEPIHVQSFIVDERQSSLRFDRSKALIINFEMIPRSPKVVRKIVRNDTEISRCIK